MLDPATYIDKTEFVQREEDESKTTGRRSGIGYRIRYVALPSRGAERLDNNNNLQ
jgi:hypothetical protein